MIEYTARELKRTGDDLEEILTAAHNRLDKGGYRRLVEETSAGSCWTANDECRSDGRAS